MPYKDKEKQRECDRKRYIANPEKFKKQSREWKAANPEKVREIDRRSRAANREKLKERSRERRIANPEKARESWRKWQAANPEKKRAQRILKQAVKNGEIKKQLCANCGNENTEAHHPDHSKPLKVIWLCRSCHKIFDNAGY